MAFSPSIQAFIPAHIAYVSQACPNWDTGKLYVVHGGSAGVDFFIDRFDIASGANETSVDIGDGSGAYPEPMGIDPMGNLYMSGAGIQNFVSFVRKTADIAPAGSWGVADASWNVPNGLFFPGDGWCGLRAGNQAYMLISANRLLENPSTHISGYPVWAMTGTPFGYYGSPAAPILYPDKEPYLCPGAQSGSSATAYLVTGPQLPGDTQHLVLYTLQIGAAAMTSAALATILPTDVDPTWTQIYNRGLVYDATDGNLLVKVFTPDVVTTAVYIFKVNTATGAIMWTVPLANFDSALNQTAYGRVLNGTYCHFNETGGGLGVPTVTTIDTITGSYSSYSTGLAGVQGSTQCYNSEIGAIILNAELSAVPGSPRLLGSTPSSFSGQWAALYVIEVTPTPVLPLAATSYSRIWGFPPGAGQ